MKEKTSCPNICEELTKDETIKIQKEPILPTKTSPQKQRESQTYKQRETKKYKDKKDKIRQFRDKRNQKSFPMYCHCIGIL